jgi:peptide/nickel transport system permease protein
MIRRIAYRLAAGLGVAWGAATLTFFAVYLTPGDPAYAIVGGPEAAPSPEVLAQVRAEYGFDDPFLVQYLHYLGRIVTGDLGTSYRLHSPVTQVLGEQLGGTVQLALTAGFLAVALALVVALLTAKRSPWVRSGSSGVELILASSPSFWLGIILLTVFSYTLHWLPTVGSGDWRALVLPSFTLALPIAAVLTQVLRSSLEETLDQPFIATARARGLGDAAVRLRHALRHSLIPLATMAGFVVGGLLGGTVIVESLFTRQGLGRTLLAAVNAKDMPVVLGVVLLSAVVYVVVNFVVDLLYPLLDPRLKEVAA